MTYPPAKVPQSSSPRRRFVRGLLLGAVAGLALAGQAARAQSAAPEWSTPQGEACIERWISLAMARLNAHDGGASFNANKPYRMNRWGVLEGRNFHSVAAPDDFPSYGYNKYRRLWEVYRWDAGTGWRDDSWDAAGVPGLQPWVRTECLPAATPSSGLAPGLPSGSSAGSSSGAPPQPLTPPQGNACGYSLGSGIYAKWIATGGERGFLGCPVSSETEAGRSPQGTSGRFAVFAGSDGGYIIWHGSGPRAGLAFEVHGCIFRLYRDAGGTLSWLGFPVSDEVDVPGGRRSDFEGGSVLWDASTRQCRAERQGGAEGGSAAPPPVSGANPPSASSTYLGCFLDKVEPNRDLSGFSFTDSQKMTVELCVAACRDRGFAYAGLQYVEYCFCGSSYGQHGPANFGPHKCEVICSGNRGQVCGGYLCNSVYSTGTTRTETPTLEPETDRLGSDYRDFDLSTADPAACRDACLRDERCQAWTYVKPDTLQGPRPRCWLKQAVPPPSRSSCCVSGVKGTAALR